jgi:hypothetical protein
VILGTASPRPEGSLPLWLPVAEAVREDHREVFRASAARQRASDVTRRRNNAVSANVGHLPQKVGIDKGNPETLGRNY